MHDFLIGMPQPQRPNIFTKKDLFSAKEYGNLFEKIFKLFHTITNLYMHIMYLNSFVRKKLSVQYVNMHAQHTYGYAFI